MTVNFTILADASLPYLDQDIFIGFKLMTYKNINDLKAKLPYADVLFCRSTLKVNQNLLSDADKIQAVATASSGIDHLDQEYLQSRDITIFDAKGCNAHAVTDYVLACLAKIMLQYNKSIKRIGIIGYGAVGSLLDARLQQLNFETVIYDPLLDYKNFESLFSTDVISVHANLHYDSPHASNNLLNQNFFNKLDPKTIVIQAARGGITDEEALLKYMTLNPKFIYCTDVYCHEPNINFNLVKNSYITTPHIAGHSIEAKYRAIYKIALDLDKYFGIKCNKAILNNQYISIDPNCWMEEIIKYYDPHKETKVLKESSHGNLREVFLKLRLLHNFRHEFLIKS